MKKIIFVLIIIFTISCKNKKPETKQVIDKKENEFNISNTVILPNYPLWSLNRLTLEEDIATYNNSEAFKLTRTSITETAYASINNIAVNYGSKYRVSLIVRQASIGSLFGIRIVGEYPNRVDAVFDLKNGLKKDVIDVGDFIDGSASIESLGDGWYKCYVITEVNADKIKIILGPSSGLGKTITWEAPTSDKCNNYIIPSSLALEELSN